MDFSSKNVVGKQGLAALRAHLPACVLAAIFAQAPLAQAIEVVEGQPTVITAGQSAAGSSSGNRAQAANAAAASGGTSYSTGTARNAAASTELYVQLQALQVEMRELRGMVEQQAFLIEQLSQRRMDDYLDLDRRIGELQQALPQVGSGPRSNSPARQNSAAANRAASNSPAPRATAARAEPVREPVTSTTEVPASLSGTAAALGNVAQPPAVPNPDDASEAREVYQAAYQQVKDREFGKAKVSLALFIKNYPASRYVPNAYFWLGELYYLDSDLKQSRDAFLALVNDHGQHRKVAEAKFKLGKIYHQLGNDGEAKAILQSVVSDHPDSKAVNPAREYLKNSL
ncbi:MAG: tol-pal system protein YbgF [Gammaproteobacteria bacterium]|nr:tol-pal system protein YbgF [Gammaproteobacteria bacterium]